MKRDPELIRKLILAVEELAPGWNMDEPGIDGYTDEQVGYHSYLLVDAGLAVGIKITSMSDTLPQYTLVHLTSAGHDFADAARDESIWKKARVLVIEKTGSVSLDVFKDVLGALAKATLGL